MLLERGEKNTFSDQVFTTFSDLPKAIRIIDNKKVFYRESKKYDIDRDGSWQNFVFVILYDIFLF